MKFIKISFLVILINISLFADSKITIYSFTDKEKAEKSLNDVAELFKKNEKINDLCYKHDLYLGIRKSPKYYLIVMEVFKDHKILLEMIEEIKKTSPTAYYSRIKYENSSLEKKINFIAPLIKKLEKLEFKPEEQFNVEVESKPEVKPKPKVESKPEVEFKPEALNIKVDTLEYTKYILYVLLFIVFIILYFFINKEKNQKSELNKEESKSKSFPIIVSDSINMEQAIKKFENKNNLYYEELENFIYKYYYAIAILQEFKPSKRHDDAKEYLKEMRVSSQRLGATILPKSILDVENNISEVFSAQNSTYLNTLDKNLQIFLKEIKSISERDL